MVKGGGKDSKKKKKGKKKGKGELLRRFHNLDQRPSLHGGKDRKRKRREEGKGGENRFGLIPFSVVEFEEEKGGGGKVGKKGEGEMPFLAA